MARGEVEPGACEVIWNVNGKPLRQPLADLQVPNGLDLLPVRRIGTYVGARNRIGMYPVLREGRALFLCAESRLEMTWFRALDIDPQVSWMHAQPFVLVWAVGSRTLVRFCDLLVKRDSGAVVYDIKPEVLAAEPHTRRMLELTARTLAGVGVTYGVLGDVAPQTAENLKRITRYKRPNVHLARQVERVLLLRPRSAGGVLNVCGDEYVGREVVLHLLATGRCRTDLSQPIHRATRLEWVTT